MRFSLTLTLLLLCSLVCVSQEKPNPKIVSLDPAKLELRKFGQIANDKGFLSLKVIDVIDKENVVVRLGDTPHFVLSGKPTKGLTVGKSSEFPGVWAVKQSQKVGGVQRFVLVPYEFNPELLKATLDPTNFSVGDVGFMMEREGKPFQFKVVEVLDEESLIVQLGNKSLVVKGFPTKGIADGKTIELPGQWKVTGTVKRGTSTRYVIEPFKEEKK